MKPSLANVLAVVPWMAAVPLVVNMVAISQCAEDSDGDGWTTTDDCDDTNAEIHPGVTDGCDGIDNDCDEVIDEDCSEERVPVYGDLVITEIMQNPAAVADNRGEWFEVYNASNDTLLMGTIVVSDNVGSFTIVDGTSIAPFDYFVFGNNDDTATNGGVTVDYEFGSALELANGSDSVTLADSIGTLLDSVSYDDGRQFPDPNGKSMNLDPEYTNPDANDMGRNWCEAKDVYGSGDFGTPGAANSSCVEEEPSPTPEPTPAG